MEDLREYFRKDLWSGYEKKFQKKLTTEELNIATINNHLYSINISDDRIMVHNYDEKKLDAFLFNSKARDEIFTHYYLEAQGNELLVVATVYSYVDDNSIINSISAQIRGINDACANCEVFLGEETITPYPTSTIVNILNKGEFRVKDFQDTGDIIINAQNPYHAILKAEGSLKDQMKKVRTK